MVLFLRQPVYILVTEVQINCEAEELSQATQLPPTASCLKSLSPAVSCTQTPRLTCPAYRNLLHFTSVTSVDLICYAISILATCPPHPKSVSKPKRRIYFYV